MRRTMNLIVKSKPDILSLGMRGADGRLLAQTKDHQIHWKAPPGEESTATYWQVPVHQGNKRWGTLEISFTPQYSFIVLGYQLRPFTLLLAFFALISFVGFLIYMKKTTTSAY